MAFLSRWLSYPGLFDRENDRECLNWRLYAGGRFGDFNYIFITFFSKILNYKKQADHKPRDVYQGFSHENHVQTAHEYHLIKDFIFRIALRTVTYGSQ